MTFSGPEGLWAGVGYIPAKLAELSERTAYRRAASSLSGDTSDTTADKERRVCDYREKNRGAPDREVTHKMWAI